MTYLYFYSCFNLPIATHIIGRKTPSRNNIKLRKIMNVTFLKCHSDISKKSTFFHVQLLSNIDMGCFCCTFFSFYE